MRLRDVETHLVEGLLDRLRDEEVAAYVAPAPGRRGPYGDTVLPRRARPTASTSTPARRDHARAVSERYLREVADELAWAGHRRRLRRAPTADEVPRWPASEDVDEPEARRHRGRRAALGPAVRPADLPPAGFDELRDALAPDAARRTTTTADDHFEPPPPPPLPDARPDRPLRLGGRASAARCSW